MEEQTTTEHAFEAWCIVELMGHQRMAGLVSEQNIAGHGFLRVDVYGEKGDVVDFTRFISPSSIYAINPCSKEIAIQMGRHSVKPISRFEVSNLLPAASEASRPPDSDPFDFDDDDDEEDMY